MKKKKNTTKKQQNKPALQVPASLKGDKILW